MSDDEHIEPASDRIPIVTDRQGQAYIPAEGVVELLRALAEVCRKNASNPDYRLDSVADAIDSEADALDCRAILRTRTT
ncbi:hypothetical protein [Streptomyces sp. NPDC054887]